MTMQLVQTVEVGSGGAASIDFTSIPQTGTDLVLVISARSSYSSTASFLSYQLNGDTTSTNYTNIELRGNGSSALSVPPSGTFGEAGFTVGSTATATTFNNIKMYITNYAGSTAKSISVDSVTENNATAATQSLVASSWSGSAGITSIKLFDFNSGTLQQYSTASLYTITKGSGGATVS